MPIANNNAFFNPNAFRPTQTANPAAITSQKIYEELEKTIKQLNLEVKKRYGLVSYKKDRFEWSGDDVKDKILELAEKIKTSITLDQAQRLVSMYLESARDSRLKAAFKRANLRLGISIEMVDGKAFVSAIDDNFSGAVAVGDEVLSYDRQSIADALQGMINPEFPGSPAADRRMALTRLTEVQGVYGDALPSRKSVVMELRSRAHGDKYVTQLTWKPTVKAEIVREAKMIRPTGATKIDSAYTAWTHKSGKTRVGYLRLASFARADVDGYKKAMTELDEVITTMNTESDVLILDVTENNSGEDEMVYATAQRFLKEAAGLPTSQYRSSESLSTAMKKEVESLGRASSDADAKNILGGSVFRGLPASLDLVQRLAASFHAIVEAEKGDFGYTAFNAYIYPDLAPSDIQYIKPLIVLADGSTEGAAERFVSILQDAKRARVIGTQTAGVGSRFESIASASALEISALLGIEAVRIPTALVKRANGEYLENIGVSPDLEVSLVEDDFTVGRTRYKAYSREVLKKAKALVSDDSKTE